VTIDLRPEAVDITGYAGDTLSVRVTVSDPAIVAGGTWTAQIRQTQSSAEIKATFAITIESPGVAVLTLAADDTDALGGFVGVWDCQVTAGTVARTIVQGKISFDPDVTRPGA
jgi:hypothetical protein